MPTDTALRGRRRASDVRSRLPSTSPSSSSVVFEAASCVLLHRQALREKHLRQRVPSRIQIGIAMPKREVAAPEQSVLHLDLKVTSPAQRPPPTRRQRWGRCRVERRDRAQGGNNPRRKPQARACSTFHGPQKPATVAFATRRGGQNGLSAGPRTDGRRGGPEGPQILFAGSQGRGRRVGPWGRSGWAGSSWVGV